MIGRSDLLEVCQTLSLLRRTLACFQKSCTHFPAEEGVLPKSVPETVMVIPRKNLGSCALGWFGVVFQG